MTELAVKPDEMQYDKITYTVPDEHHCGGGAGGSLGLAGLFPSSMRISRSYKTILKGRRHSFWRFSELLVVWFTLICFMV